MTTDHKQRHKHRRRKVRRVKRTIWTIIIIVIILYLATIMTGLFGGSFGQQLRSSQLVDAPATFIEENLDLSFIPNYKNNNPHPDAFEITVQEDALLFNDVVATIAEIEGLIGDNTDKTVILKDDNAKHVTYTAVLNELERLGVTVEEK
ncbi:MAG: hypothetical protein KAQ68_11605 [Clostridiales bacterium]|nr:hypothetical protein [Clostridiales bacterium]